MLKPRSNVEKEIENVKKALEGDDVEAIKTANEALPRPPTSLPN